MNMVLRAIFDLLVGGPRRVTTIGIVVAHVGWIFFIPGLFGYAHKIVIDAIDGEGIKTFAEMYPRLPLWWVPESLPAMALAIATLLAGVAVVFVGRRVDRLYGLT